ncbi:MAG TPA: hypothetical protein VMU88_05875 [bacterium]|nr:hypothetical protein [bacterium]
MSSRWSVYALILAAGFLTLTAFSCNPYGAAGVSGDDVVATVGDTKITFADWMRQMDLLRVFSPQPIDPDNAEQAREVLQSLEDQDVVLAALRQANYTDPKFDEAMQKELIQADLQLKQIKDKLKKDEATVNRLEKNYKDSYTKMLLSQHFAASQVDKVVVTEKEIRDRYALIELEAKKQGQQVPPYNDKVKQQIKLRLQADKLLTQFQGNTKIDQKEEVIQKYLGSLSPSQQALEGSGPAPSAAPAASAK